MPTETHPLIDAETLDAVAAALACTAAVGDEAEARQLRAVLAAGAAANAGRTSEAKLALRPVLEASSEPAALFLCFQLWFRASVAPGVGSEERAEGLRAAARIAERRVELGRSTPGSLDLGRAHTNLALALHYLGPEHHAEAERHYLAAVECDRTVGHDAGLARGLGNLGNFYEETGRPGEAEPLYRRALSIARSHGLRKIAAGQLANLGDVAQGRGESAEAVGCWREAVEIFRGLGESGAAAALERKLAMTAAREGCS